MRADRLLSILLLLQTHQRLTGRDLAKRLEVSERTIHRDMEALGMAGVPVMAERGTGGGWSLLEGYRTNLTGLTSSEMQALLLASPTRLLADLGLRQAAEAALLKLLAALPAVSRSNAEYARQRLHVDGAGWHEAAEAVPYLLPIQEAIWQERTLRLTYQRGDGATVERLVDPLGLVAKGGVWYLVASVEGELRSYRVSRVLGAEATEASFARPPAFDLAAYWQQSTADFKANLPRYPATLRADPAIVPQCAAPTAMPASNTSAHRKATAGSRSPCSLKKNILRASMSCASGRRSLSSNRQRCASASFRRQSASSRSMPSARLPTPAHRSAPKARPESWHVSWKQFLAQSTSHIAHAPRFAERMQ